MSIIVKELEKSKNTLCITSDDDDHRLSPTPRIAEPSDHAKSGRNVEKY